MRTRNQKKWIIIGIILVILIIAGVGIYYYISNQKQPEPHAPEVKKEKYKISKLVSNKKITFELINQESNVSEHTIILDNMDDPSIYDMIMVEGAKGYYYIVTKNTVAEKYYRVYNKEYKKISEDLEDTYDSYEILKNGDIKLYKFEVINEDNDLGEEYENNGNGFIYIDEYTYNQEGEVVSQNSIGADYIIPMSKLFAFDGDNLYIIGNHKELLAKTKLERTGSESYRSYKCYSESGKPIGHDENSEWIHYGNLNSKAKKYIYHNDTGTITTEESECVVE